ncbi:probable serine/threonine-protein kinase roco6 isoform X1 [Argopecten irradians]|uniref:probable serine/threonine-protein kinase roco6 isoform X1 n=1 Tax=Argopecten irradians TaxID=31199 RepID=UPI00370FBA03
MVTLSAPYDWSVNEYLKLFSGPREKYRHIRVVFVGPENVGKTTLCLRLQKKEVDINVRCPTRGADLFLQLYEIGWESKRWTPLVINRPDEVIHRRFGGMLRNNIHDGKNDENEDVHHSTHMDAVTAESAEQTLQEPHTVDTEAITKSLGNENEDHSSIWCCSIFTKTEDVDHSTRMDAVKAKSAEQTLQEPHTVDTVITESPGNDTERGLKMSWVACEDESEEVYQQSNKQKEDLAFLSMWDMGGDLAFQATNVVFISAHGVYILTFRAIDYFTDNLQLVRLKNWVRNIGAYSSRAYNPSKLRPHHPPIIIVGTHMDQVNTRFKDTPSEREDRLRVMRQDICSFAELGNSKEEGFVFLRFCTVDNSIDNDPAFDKLRNYIVEAAVHQDQWEQELPASWLALEREILKQREWKHVLTLKEIIDLDNKCESPIGDEENIKMFLEYLHSTRSVLYFRQYDKVIVNPQWVINAFREILTDEKFLESDNLLLEADLIKYSHQALLTVDLAKMLWNSTEEDSFIQHIDILLAFLEEFGLLVKACVGQDEQGKPVYDENYTVPSKLQSIKGIKQIHDLLNVKGTVCSRTLCFVFKDVFTPQELFDRIYAGVIKAFKPIEKNSARSPNQGPSKQIYKGLGCFMIDDLCNMVVHTQWEQSVITVTLFTTSEPRIPEGTGKRVREALEVIIRHTLEVSRQGHLQYRHMLHCTFSLDQSDSPRQEDGIVRAARGVACQGGVCSGKHILTKLDWQVWFPVSKEKFQEVREYACELLTDKGLQVSIAVKLGANWECVMTRLGISRHTLDRIKMANPHFPLTQITNALVEWRDTAAQQKTEWEMLEDLSEAFREYGADSEVIDEQVEIYKTPSKED